MPSQASSRERRYPLPGEGGAVGLPRRIIIEAGSSAGTLLVAYSDGDAGMAGSPYAEHRRH